MPVFSDLPPLNSYSVLCSVGHCHSNYLPSFCTILTNLWHFFLWKYVKIGFYGKMNLSIHLIYKIWKYPFTWLSYGLGKAELSDSHRRLFCGQVFLAQNYRNFSNESMPYLGSNSRYESQLSLRALILQVSVIWLYYGPKHLPNNFYDSLYFVSRTLYPPASTPLHP